MSVSIYRKGWAQIFTQMRRPTRFLSRFFTMKPGGSVSGEKIAIDVERYDEDVAVAVKKFTGPNLNEFDEFVTKEFTPPAYSEGFSLDVADLINRLAGVNPFDSAARSDAALLISKAAKGMALNYDKIARGVELQASQIFQTGKLALKNASGATVYELDFSPKATHFPDASATWGGGTDDPLADLESLAEVIRADGKVDPDMLIFGKNALDKFLSTAKVKDRLDNQRYNIGEIAPRFVNSGATFYGFVWVGQYRFEIWGYKETYKDPQSGAATKYIGDDKVVMTSSGTRLDFCTARVPLPLGPDPRVAGLLPGRMVDRAEGFDVTPNIYATPNGMTVMGEMYSRPLLVPVQIDGFGCLDVTP